MLGIMVDMLPAAVTAGDLPLELEALQAFALEQNRLACVLWEQLESLQHQIAQLNRARFGASSERLAGQAELFDAAIDMPVPPEPAKVQVTGHSRKGRPALPKDLPRTRIEYDLSDDQKAAFDALERIGEERSETLHYEPSRLTVIEHIRFKYAAKKDGESTIVTASAQPSPLPKSNASASLLANILVSTYVDHLPLNRQEMRYARRGIHLPRATLCEWKLAAAELLAALLPPLRAHQLQAPRMHVDDTTLPLLEKGRKTTRTARLWGYLGAGQREENGVWVEHPPAVVFEFAESRAGSHPQGYLKTYKGYLQADAYSGHEALYETGDIIAVGCWAHCRRRFFEIAKTQSKPGLAAQALQWIAQLYAIEARINHQTPDRQICGAPSGDLAGISAVPSMVGRQRHRFADSGTACQSVRLRVTSLASADSLHRERCSVTGQQRFRTANPADCAWKSQLDLRGLTARRSCDGHHVFIARHGSLKRFRTVCMAEGNTGEVAVVSRQSRA